MLLFYNAINSSTDNYAFFKFTLQKFMKSKKSKYHIFYYYLIKQLFKLKNPIFIRSQVRRIFGQGINSKKMIYWVMRNRFNFRKIHYVTDHSIDHAFYKPELGGFYGYEDYTNTLTLKKLGLIDLV